MVQLSKNANIKFQLNNEEIQVVDWEKITINASFQDNTQPSIAVSEIKIPPPYASIITDWINAGLNGGAGVFEGPSFDISTYNNSSNYQAFKGYVNLKDKPKFYNDGTIGVKIKEANGLANVNDKLRALTYGYLEEIGVFSQSDYKTINYFVIKNNTAIEIALMIVSAYVLISETQKAIKDLADKIATVAGLTLTALTGEVGALIYAILVVIVQLAYTIALIIALKNLAVQIINILLPIKRKAKGCSLYKLLDNVLTHLELTLVTDIEWLKNVYYLPTNLVIDERNALTGVISIPAGTTSGIPNINETLYNCADMFGEILKMVNAKPTIDSDNFYLYTRDSDFWRAQSNYRMKDVVAEFYSINSDEFVSNFITSFQTDPLDEWTIGNYKGTSYTTSVTAINEINKANSEVNGFERIDFPFALGNRKDKFSALETIIEKFAGAIDTLVGVFGGSSNMQGRVEKRLGYLKISDNKYTIPKLLYIEGDVIPSNHRNFLSSKYIWNTFQKDKSFVYDNFKAQKKTYEGVEVPFGLENFLEVISNSYFYSSSNMPGKILGFEWTIANDTMDADYELDHVYTKNVVETNTEP